MIIAVVGNGDGCGKSTAAKYLAKHLGKAQVVETGDVLRRMMRIAHNLPDAMDDKAVTAKYRAEMRALGDYLTAVDPAMLVRIAASASEATNTIVAGIRRMRELHACAELLDRLVYVQRQDADSGNTDIAIDDPFQGCGRPFHPLIDTLDNNGTLADLDAACHRLVTQWRAGTLTDVEE